MRRTVTCAAKQLRFRNKRHLTFACSRSIRYRPGHATVHLARDGKTCIIEWFQAIPAFNRIGSRVYHELEKMLAEAGYTTVELAAEPIIYGNYSEDGTDDVGFNSPFDFWKKMGFKDTGQIEKSGELEFHIMRKRMRLR